MKAIIHPSRLKGNLQAPPSKSSMQRALAAALVRKGESVIINPGHSNDDLAAAGIIQQLGAIIKKQPGRWIISSNGVQPAGKIIDCKESGLSIRMFTPIAALSDTEITITGSGSLVDRPMDVFDDVLPLLGVHVNSTHGKLPLRVTGPFKARDVEVDGSVSSQFLTGLLFAFAASGASGVIIKVRNLKSKPYIDLTLDVLKQFGLPVPHNKNYHEFNFQNHTPVFHPVINYTVESDWSSAAFLLVAGAIAGRPVQITGLDLASTQADRRIFEVLMDSNAAMATEAKGIKIMHSKMNAFSFDATDSPDLFPPLVALAAYCDGVSSIYGVQRLVHKESNRATSLQHEFKKMGVRIESDDQRMLVHGNHNHIKGATVHAHHDHRIAMALAVAALGAEGSTTIEGAEAVNKSYPGFFNDLKKLGADVSLDNKLFIHE